MRTICKLRNFLPAAAFLFLTALPAFPKSPILGLQMLLLQCYNDASMNTFLSALESIPRTKRPAVVEIAIAPYLDTSCSIPAPKNRFTNMELLIDKLRSLSIQVRATIHVGDIHEIVRNNNMGTRMKQVWDGVISRHLADPNVQFHMSASLEDQYTIAAFQDAADRLLTQLDYGQVKSLVDARRFFFRRNTEKLDSGHVNTRTTTYSVFRNTGDPHKPAFAIPIHYEAHGAWPRSRFEIWSNDGFLVYVSEDEHHHHHGSAGLNTNEQLSLQTFEQRSASATVALFWRPAYNLFDVQTVGAERRYSRNGQRKDTPSGKFDGREAATLVQIFSR